MEEEDGLFGVAFEGFRVVWVVERLQNGTWTARYCWHRGTDAAAAAALQTDVLNGRSRRLPGTYQTEQETLDAIHEAIRLEARWS